MKRYDSLIFSSKSGGDTGCTYIPVLCRLRYPNPFLRCALMAAEDSYMEEVKAYVSFRNV